MVDLSANSVVKRIKLGVQVLNAVPKHGNKIDRLLLFSGRLLLWSFLILADALLKVSVSLVNLGCDSWSVLLLSILQCLDFLKSASRLSQWHCIYHILRFGEVLRVNFVLATVAERATLKCFLSLVNVFPF